MRYIAVTTESFGGFGKLQGLLRIEGADIVLEFQHKDSMFGLNLSAPQRISLPLARIDRIEFGRGFLGLMPWIRIRTDDFEFTERASAKVPGTARLRVQFSERRDGAAFVEHVNGIAAELRHRRWRAEVDALVGPTQSPKQEITQLPGPHSTVPTAPSSAQPPLQRPSELQ